MSGYLSCSTLVIAAVKVVLPWSMCPMVPMLTCGLVRSNFAFATVVLLWDLRTPFRGAFGLVGRCFSLVPVGHVLGGALGRAVWICAGCACAALRTVAGDYSPRALAMISNATLEGTCA